MLYNLNITSFSKKLYALVFVIMADKLLCILNTTHGFTSAISSLIHSPGVSREDITSYAHLNLKRQRKKQQQKKQL